jgi:hypothetical protein
MADDLVVDYDALEASAQSLGRIGREFEGAARLRDELRGSLGSGAIADAMDEFVGNWDRHRHDVVTSIRDLEGATRSVMASFGEADRRLGRSLRTQGSTGVVGSR